MIPITKPSIDSEDHKYIKKVLSSKILTDGYFQNKTEELIKSKLNSKFIALTQSCTAALEISAILINLKHGDEVIMPSYGFVSVANAVVLRGAKPIFSEIDPLTLNIAYSDIKRKITKKTKAVYIIHYAGNSCEIEKIYALTKKKKIYLIEDAAHAFLAKYKNKYLGTIGDIGTFSFHETKNLVAGQGGCISINNSKLIKRANFILDKGTNRRNFIKNYKKKIIKSNEKKFYSWVDIGSEYRLPEISCALLYSQILKANKIQKKRKMIWSKFNRAIISNNSNKFDLLRPPQNVTSSYHLFVLIFKNNNLSLNFKNMMQKNGIAATFHYVPLHRSLMGTKIYNKKLPITDKIYDCIVRLPLYPDLTFKECDKIIRMIKKFSKKFQ